jgi:hypothetical protein
MKSKAKQKKTTKPTNKSAKPKVVAKPKENSVPEQMAADITRVANKLNTTPDKVSKLEYFDNSKNFSEWDFRKVGGFASVKNLYLDRKSTRLNSSHPM